MTPDDARRLAKDIVLYAAAFGVVLSLAGWANRKVNVEPILRQVREERVSREYGDSLLALRVIPGIQMQQKIDSLTVSVVALKARQDMLLSIVQYQDRVILNPRRH